VTSLPTTSKAPSSVENLLRAAAELGLGRPVDGYGNRTNLRRLEFESGSRCHRSKRSPTSSGRLEAARPVTTGRTGSR
jgi:hypothetical protein